jgi:hypothetical protein
VSITADFVTDVHGPVTAEQVTTGADQQRVYDDEAALSILAQDVETVDADQTLKNFSQQWSQSDILLQSPAASSAFYNPAKANVPRFTLSNILDVVCTKIHEAIFYDTPAFMLRPNPKVNQKVMWAKQAVLETQLREMHFDVEVQKGIEQCALLGTQIYKWGWLSSSKEVVVYKRKNNPAEISTPLGTKTIDTVESDEFEKTTETETIERPWLKYRDLKWLLVDTSCPVGDIREAGFVIDRDYLTFDDLDALRDVEGYDIPSREALKKLFFPPEATESAPGNEAETIPTGLRAWLSHSVGRNVNVSADPYANKLEMLERWDKNKVTVALKNRHGYLLIRNEANPFGCVPFFSSNWRNIPNNFYGQGLGQLIGPDQRVEQGSLNAYLDILSFLAKPSYVRQKSLNTPSQNERLDLGTIISVEGPVQDAFKLIEQPRVDQSIVMAIGSAQSSAANTSGANELVGQGNSMAGSHSTGMRSGTGASLVGQAAASRLDGVIEKFVRQVFIPWLDMMDELNSERLPTGKFRDILGDDTARDYSDIDHIEFRNADVNYEVLAGTHMGPRKEMAQFMPFLQQMINTPALLEDARQQGLAFDFESFFKMFCDLAGFKYSQSFFRKMTPEQQQQAQANSPAAIQAQKIQATQKIQQDKFTAQQQLEDQRNLGRAANEVTRSTLEKTMTPLAVEGEAGNQGFGDAVQ